MTDDIWYLLRNCIFERRYGDAISILNDQPDLIDLRNSIGETILHHVAVENDIDGVKWLYSRGFKLDTKNEFGTPAIFEVAQLSYRELLLWFYKNGADFKIKDDYGDSIIEYLDEYEKTEMISFVKEKCA
jgi:ankyrin repeat protein